MKKSIVIFLLLVVNYEVFSQVNIGFFQMQNATPQSNNYNAAAFPRAKSFVCLPGLAGLNLSVNNSFGLLDGLTPTGDSTLVDIDRFLLHQKDKAYFNTSFLFTDFMFGTRIGDKMFFTLFVNERVDGTVFYPVQLMNFLWEGNGAYIGKNYVVDDISYDATYYREWGVGVGRDFTILGYKTSLGVRLKYLTGIAHSSIKDNLSLSFYTSEDDNSLYSVDIALNNGVARSAGISMLEDEVDVGYLIHNGNTGFAMDVAGEVDLSDKLTVGLAINDMGFITWKEHTEVTRLDGVSFSFEGVDLDDIDQFTDGVKDSIDALELDTANTKFTTTLNSRMFISGSYKLTKDGYAQATISNYFTQGRMKSAFGIGYLQNVGNWFAVNVSGTVTPQRGVDMGMGLMIRGGFFQTYVAVDNIWHTINIPKASGVNVKFGFNFLFGKPAASKKRSKKSKVDVDLPDLLGEPADSSDDSDSVYSPGEMPADDNQEEDEDQDDN